MRRLLFAALAVAGLMLLAPAANASWPNQTWADRWGGPGLTPPPGSPVYPNTGNVYPYTGYVYSGPVETYVEYESYSYAYPNPPAPAPAYSTEIPYAYSYGYGYQPYYGGGGYGGRRYYRVLR